MGGGSSKSCSVDQLKDSEGTGNKAYAWYGFSVLTADCKQPLGPGYSLKKFPNVFMYVSIALAVILLLVLITRVRAG